MPPARSAVNAFAALVAAGSLSLDEAQAALLAAAGNPPLGSAARTQLALALHDAVRERQPPDPAPFFPDQQRQAAWREAALAFAQRLDAELADPRSGLARRVQEMRRELPWIPASVGWKAPPERPPQVAEIIADIARRNAWRRGQVWGDYCPLYEPDLIEMEHSTRRPKR